MVLYWSGRGRTRLAASGLDEWEAMIEWLEVFEWVKPGPAPPTGYPAWHGQPLH
jgi:hypothetical protein